MVKLEIEKKWYLKGEGEIKPRPTILLKESHVLYQWYIVADNYSQVRVSRRIEAYGDRYTLNIKNGNGLVRKEVMIDITYKDFLKLIAQCDVEIAPIKKELFVYYYQGKELEVSRVDDSWYYAEVEFDNEEEASSFDISDCFDSDVEVINKTHDPNFMMKNYWRRTRLMMV